MREGWPSPPAGQTREPANSAVPATQEARLKSSVGRGTRHGEGRPGGVGLAGESSQSLRRSRSVAAGKCLEVPQDQGPPKVKCPQDRSNSSTAVGATHLSSNDEARNVRTAASVTRLPRDGRRLWRRIHTARTSTRLQARVPALSSRRLLRPLSIGRSRRFFSPIVVAGRPPHSECPALQHRTDSALDPKRTIARPCLNRWVRLTRRRLAPRGLRRRRVVRQRTGRLMIAVSLERGEGMPSPTRTVKP